MNEEHLQQICISAHLPFSREDAPATLLLESGELWSANNQSSVSRGSYGSVHKLFDKNAPNAPMAVKVFHNRDSKFSAAGIELLMATVAKATSSMVAVPRGAGVVKRGADVVPYIAYEFIKGSRLCDVVLAINTGSDSSQSIPRWNLSCAVVCALIGNFQSLSNVIHSDLKADNVMVSSFGGRADPCYSIHAIDFGLAGIRDAPMDPRRLTGTGKWWLPFPLTKTFSRDMDTFSVTLMLAQILNPQWSKVFAKGRKFSLNCVTEACAGIAQEQTRKVLESCLRHPDSRKLVEHFVA